MPLVLRHTGLSSPAYADQLDYTIYEDGRAVGVRWFWSITVYVPPSLGIKTNSRTATIEHCEGTISYQLGQVPQHRRAGLTQLRVCLPAICAAAMPLRPRTLPAGFIAPCLPTSAPLPPSGALWLHEIKHDGFRVITRKNGTRVRLYSRPGNDLTHRFPLIVEALSRLHSRSCIIDGEAVACGEDGIADFERIRYRRNDASVFLYAFDLIELDGNDLRREPLNVRKATLTSLLARAMPGLRFNEHLTEDGPTVLLHACKMGLEGIVSKRKDSRYSSGRSPHWIKSKNPNAPAVKREGEEDWRRWNG